jgi:DNA-binding CsgD family transcriptional regulator
MARSHPPIFTRYRDLTAVLPVPARLVQMTEESSVRRLSLSETRVARLIAEGLSDEQVAQHLGISVTQVSAELAGVFRKLGLRSRTELALLAPERGPHDHRETEEDGRG